MKLILEFEINDTSRRNVLDIYYTSVLIKMIKSVF